MFKVSARCFMEPLVHIYNPEEHLLFSSCQGPPRWLAGTFFLLQMRRGVTLYDGEERQPRESCLSLYSQLSLLLKLRCLHDVPPQTFIRPPKMVTFHIIAVLLNGEEFFSICVQYVHFSSIWAAFEINCSFRCACFNFQVVLGQRKQSSWQVFLTRCRQIWCMPSQIQPLLEGKLSIHTFSFYVLRIWVFSPDVNLFWVTE